MNHLIDILQLSPEEIMELVNTACDIIDHPRRLCPQVRRQNTGHPVLRALYPHPSQL